MWPGVREGGPALLGAPTPPPSPTEPLGPPPKGPIHPPPLPHSVCQNGRLHCLQVKQPYQRKWLLPCAWPAAPQPAPPPSPARAPHPTSPELMWPLPSRRLPGPEDPCRLQQPDGAGHPEPQARQLPDAGCRLCACWAGALWTGVQAGSRTAGPAALGPRSSGHMRFAGPPRSSWEVTTCGSPPRPLRAQGPV